MKSVRPTSEFEAEAYFSAFVIENIEGCDGGYAINHNDDYSVVDLGIFGENGSFEYKDIKVSYVEADASAVAKIKGYAEKCSGDRTFVVSDLEYVDYIMCNYQENFSKVISCLSNDYKKLFENTNVRMNIDVRAGDGGRFFESQAGIGTLKYDGNILGMAEFTGGIIKKIIYVPTDTLEDKYVETVQNRINEYLGNESVKVAEAGSISELEEFDYKFSDLELSPSDKYYKLTYDGKDYDALIIADSTKVMETKKESKSVDAATNVSVKTDSKEVPADTSLVVKKVTDGEEFEKIKEVLSVENSVSFDLKLYTESENKYITSLSDGYFEVSLPIPDALKGKELVVYYVDDNGNVEEYPVTVDSENAAFKTKHFSIYTLAEKKQSTEVEKPSEITDKTEEKPQETTTKEPAPATYDGSSMMVVFMLLMSGIMMIFVGVVKCKKEV